jgi:hypothetical protein
LAWVRPQDERGRRGPTGLSFFLRTGSAKPSAIQMAHIIIVDFIIIMKGLRQKGARFRANLSSRECDQHFVRVRDNSSKLNSFRSNTMTPEQKTLVQTTWDLVVSISDTAAQLFYGKLFEVDPSTRPMFNSTDMPEQRKKLMQALATVIAGLDNLAPLIPVLQNLGKKHVAYGVLD